MSTFEERRIGGTGGVELAVRMPGAASDVPPVPDALPVLLVHGLSSNARLWDGVSARLAARGHPVAALDQRGHGRSGKPDVGYDWDTLCRDLLAVADGLGWDRFAAAGQSWGGNVVVELAARHPSRVAALVLVDGGTIELADHFADWPTCEVALAPPPLEGTAAERFARQLRAHHLDWPDEGIEASLANVEVLPDGTIRPWLSRAHHLQILRLLWQHRPSERWAAITAEVVLVPAEDPTTPDGRFAAAKRDEVSRAQRALAHATTCWVVGDHDLHAQHPDRIAEIIHNSAVEVRS